MGKGILGIDNPLRLLRALFYMNGKVYGGGGGGRRAQKSSLFVTMSLITTSTDRKIGVVV